jgi:hypothetical protein
LTLYFSLTSLTVFSQPVLTSELTNQIWSIKTATRSYFIWGLGDNSILTSYDLVDGELIKTKNGTWELHSDTLYINFNDPSANYIYLISKSQDNYHIGLIDKAKHRPFFPDEFEMTKYE